MTTIDDVKEFVELISKAIYLDDKIKNDDFSDKVTEGRERIYNSICEELLKNKVFSSGGISLSQTENN